MDHYKPLELTTIQVVVSEAWLCVLMGLLHHNTSEVSTATLTGLFVNVHRVFWLSTWETIHNDVNNGNIFLFAKKLITLDQIAQSPGTVHF